MSVALPSEPQIAGASPANFGWLATIDDPQPYTPAVFHQIISDAVVDVAEGRERLLIISAPVQHGKTLTASVLTSAWFLGTHPEKYVVAASYSTDFAEDKVGAPARNMLEQYGQRFFGVSVDRKSSSRGRWDTTGGGGFLAAGVDKRIAGRRVDLAIIDDPVGGLEDVATPQSRDRVWDWFLSELYPRRAPGCGFIVVMSRWHEDDFVGRLLNWAPTIGLTPRLLDFPAIALENDALGRTPGEALWPEVRDIAFLEEQRAAMGTRRFDAQFQGRPRPDAGALFKREWFSKTYRDLPSDIVRGAIYLDGAWKDGIGNDRSAMAAWLTNGKDYFIVDAFAGRMEYPDLKVKAAAFWDRHRNAAPTMRCCVEDAASGIPLVQEFKRSTNIPIIGVKVDKSKYVRAEAVTPEFESGRVYVPEGAAWFDEWMEEHVAFPSAKHDDYVDTSSGGLGQIKASPSNYIGFA